MKSDGDGLTPLPTVRQSLKTAELFFHAYTNKNKQLFKGYISFNAKKVNDPYTYFS